MNCSTPGFLVLHYLWKFAQTHVHWVNDAIQPCQALSPPSHIFNLSLHQGVFKWASSLNQVAKSTGASASASVFPMNTQGWFSLGLTGLISFLSKELSWVFSGTTAWKHQFFGTQPSLWFNSHMTTGKIIAFIIGTFVGKEMSLLFYMLSSLAIAFLPRSKWLPILWL